MKLTKEQAEKALDKMEQMVDGMDKAIILIATPDDSLMTCTDDMSMDELQGAFCSANIALTSLLRD